MSDRPYMVVTGATSGIGEAAALELARRGAQLAIVARNEAKAAASAGAIAGSSGVEPDVFIADVSDLDDVRRVAKEIEGATDRLDVLVNNAGIHDAPGQASAQGFDLTMATNYLGPFLLTNLLLDRLKASAPARVVTVSSEAHRVGWSLDVGAIERVSTGTGLAGERQYGRSKLADLVFALELARRLDGTGVTSNALCPGMVATNLVGTSDRLMRIAGSLSRTPLVRTPAQGAEMTVRLATDPSLADVSGRFFTSTAIARLLPMIPSVRNHDLQRRLWERTTDLVGLAA